MSSRSLSVTFVGHELLLDGSGALYWPVEGMLVVSDLHFEKGSFLAQHGSLIPSYDTIDTLERLQAVINHYQPRRLVMLGDSFHDRRAWLRLDAALRERILALTGCAHCLWIEGNHDVVLEAHGLSGFVAEQVVAGVTLTHEPLESDMPQIFGHYHPAFSLTDPVRVRGRCFVQGATRFAMPSFGSYTGGLDIRDAAFKEVFGEHEAVYLLHKGSIHALPQPKARLPRRFRHWK